MRRSARWLLVLALIFAETNYVMMSDRTSGLMSFQVILGFAMILFVGVTSASSFKVEKESGAFELLLVAPISEETLIINRIKAVWAYYAPVFLTWIAFLGFVSANFPSTGYGLRAFVGSALLSIVLSMVTLPLAGLYFAIRLKNFISILLLTLCFGAVLPFFTWIWVTMAFYLFAYGSAFLSYRSSFPFEALVIGSHYFLALKFYNSVRDYLKARNFA